MTKVAVLVGSLSSDSINKRYAEVLQELAPEGVEFVELTADLPLYSRDYDADYPEVARQLKAQIEDADGVLLVTPEYNRSMSGVIKNAVDWASRPWGTNSFNGKPVAITGASIGDLGTSQAQQALRNSMLFLNTKVMGQPEAYVNIHRILNEDGSVNPASVEFLTEYIDAVVKHIEANKA